jgi:hypothetical protein
MEEAIRKREWINSISTIFLLALGLLLATPTEVQDHLPARCYSTRVGTTAAAPIGVALADAPRISETIYVGGAVYARTAAENGPAGRATLEQVSNLR